MFAPVFRQRLLMSIGFPSGFVLRMLFLMLCYFWPAICVSLTLLPLQRLWFLTTNVFDSQLLLIKNRMSFVNALFIPNGSLKKKREKVY